MYNILLKYKENGECIHLSHLPKGHQVKSDEESVESLLFDLEKWHKEPFLSEYKLKKIQKKQKELINNFSYVFGLSQGYQNDEEQKAWIESIIIFDEQYKNVLIDQETIEFPVDPQGNQEIINF
jgi:hypothetical protein